MVKGGCGQPGRSAVVAELPLPASALWVKFLAASLRYASSYDSVDFTELKTAHALLNASPAETVTILLEGLSQLSQIEVDREHASLSEAHASMGCRRAAAKAIVSHLLNLPLPFDASNLIELVRRAIFVNEYDLHSMASAVRVVEQFVKANGYSALTAELREVLKLLRAAAENASREKERKLAVRVILLLANDAGEVRGVWPLVVGDRWADAALAHFSHSKA